MHKIRTVFKKTGRAKYISHLDLQRFMLRAFKRSGLPIWYTEGYNPQPYVAFALALSLGFESECELMDFQLNEEVPYVEIVKRLNGVMPEGIEFISAFEPKSKVKEIVRASYSVEIDAPDVDGVITKFQEFMQSEKIPVEKKTKKGKSEIDIKPHAEVDGVKAYDRGFSFGLNMPAGTQVNYNPQLFIGAFKDACGIEFEAVRICRTAILCENGKNFE